MILNQINLTEFKPNFRQALLFSMIEGLNEGGAFTFIDSRSPQDIENELGTAGLIGYHWKVKESAPQVVTVVIYKKVGDRKSPDSCCGFCEKTEKS